MIITLRDSAVDQCESCGRVRADDGRLRHRPTERKPSIEELEDMVTDAASCRATDGCEPVDPDGWCEHGHASWLLALGWI